ncbi:MAG: universal stress protein [Dehalococcoidia bacterium]
MFPQVTSMYERILVAVDGSDTSDAALAEALTLSHVLPATTLRVVSVADMPAGVLTAEGANEVPVERSRRESADKVLEAAMATVRAGGLEAEQVVLESIGGAIADTIVDEARRWGADLIVVGTHGRRGWRRVIVGSVAEGVARLSDRPVLLVHNPEKKAALGGSAQPA